MQSKRMELLGAKQKSALWPDKAQSEQNLGFGLSPWCARNYILKISQAHDHRFNIYDSIHRD